MTTNQVIDLHMFVYKILISEKIVLPTEHRKGATVINKVLKAKKKCTKLYEVTFIQKNI